LVIIDEDNGDADDGHANGEVIMMIINCQECQIRLQY